VSLTTGNALMRPLIAFAILLLAAPILAQSSAEVNAGIQFNFLNPGASHLGMGGAFIGGADDATAAYANPAGLINILRPEVSLEGRLWTYGPSNPEAGRGSGTPSGFGADTVWHIREATTRRNVPAVSFASAAYPSERWAVAVYYHQLANYVAEPEQLGIFLTTTVGDIRFYPTRSTLDLQIVSAGAAAAFRLLDNVYVGLDVARTDFELHSTTKRYDFDGFNPADFKTLRNTQLQEGDDSAIRYGGGMIWDPVPSLRFGAVYRRGPSYDVTATTISEPKLSTTRKSATCPAKFHVPDFYGVGVSVRPNAFLHINADVVRVTYSKMSRDFVEFSEISTACESQSRAKAYRVPDGREYHLGIRYVAARRNDFLRRHPLTLRAGAWREPAHALEYTRDEPQRFLFSQNRAAIHGSLGFSVILNRRSQVSLAMDVSRHQRIVSISTLARY
jgi:long-subunit fatty acid transport protein